MDRDEASTARLDALYRSTVNIVRRIVRRAGVPKRYVDDVTHDVFAVALSKVHVLPRGVGPGFVVRAAKWCALQFRTLSYNRRECLDDACIDGEHQAPGAGAEAELMCHERHIFVHHLLERVDYAHRIVVMLHYLDGATCREISHALNMPLPSVESRLLRGRRKLIEAARDVPRMHLDALALYDHNYDTLHDSITGRRRFLSTPDRKDGARDGPGCG